MKFESSSALMDPEESRFEESGRLFEEHMLPPVYCQWDGEKWRENKDHRDEMLFQWFEENIFSEMPEEDLRHVLEIPRGSSNNPRRTSSRSETLNRQKKFSAFNRLDREKRKNLALNWCKNHSPARWDPENPLRRDEKTGEVQNGDMASLHSYVLNYLQNMKVEDRDGSFSLKLFSTIDTPVDDINGIDAFYDFDGAVVTLDLTKNKLKSESGPGHEKADIVITDIDMSSEERKKEVAQLIARELWRKRKGIEKNEKDQKQKAA